MAEELSIGVVSQRSGLAVSAIRFYEERGIVTSTRTDGGQRRYHRDALRRLAFLQAAQRVGLSLDEIVHALSTLPAERAPTRADWARLSEDWKPLLDERIRVLTRLRDQVDSCVGCGCLSMRNCALVNAGDKASTFGPGPRYLLGDESEAP